MIAPDTWRVRLAGHDPLSLNDRDHTIERARRVTQWRIDAGWAARDAGVPQLERIAVTLEAGPPRNARRDEDNLSPSLKPSIDGLRDAGVIADDTPAYVALSTVRLVAVDRPVLPVWTWTLVVTAWTCVECGTLIADGQQCSWTRDPRGQLQGAHAGACAATLGATP